LQATLAAGAKASGKSLDEVRNARRMQNPAQRFGTATEFGAFCAFICSSHAGYLTGQNILLDGGAYPGTF
jgi:3-oxoacyl-[acyl-carrier protein] reductase